MLYLDNLHYFHNYLHDFHKDYKDVHTPLSEYKLSTINLAMGSSKFSQFFTSTELESVTKSLPGQARHGLHRLPQCSISIQMGRAAIINHHHQTKAINLLNQRKPHKVN